MTDPPPAAAGRRPPRGSGPAVDPQDPVVGYVMATSSVSRDAAVEIVEVQGQACNVLDAMRPVLGSRFGDLRIAEAGHIVVAVEEPGPADEALAERIADEFGIPGWVRVEEFVAEWITVWPRLHAMLEELAQTEPCPFHYWPGGSDRRRPPYTIALAAHAEHVAARLWQQFGPYLELTVGALDYPPRPGQVRQRRPRRGCPTSPAEPWDSTQFTVALDGELSVPSGSTTSHRLIVTNHTATAVDISTGDELTTEVLDPDSGRVVGGPDGVSTLIGRTFSVAPGATVTIPLRVGTASYEADLGYALPPGRWNIRATLRLGDGLRLRRDRRVLITPPLPITITDA